jgi:hypothetical protein
MLWELFGTPRRFLGLDWDPFGKVFLGVFQGRNGVGTCLGCVLGCVWDMFAVFFLFYGISQIMCCGTTSQNSGILGHRMGLFCDHFVTSLWKFDTFMGFPKICCYGNPSQIKVLGTPLGRPWDILGRLWDIMGRLRDINGRLWDISVWTNIYVRLMHVQYQG